MLVTTGHCPVEYISQVCVSVERLDCLKQKDVSILVAIELFYTLATILTSDQQFLVPTTLVYLFLSPG